jgi:hypothetical protein
MARVLFKEIHHGHRALGKTMAAKEVAALKIQAGYFIPNRSSRISFVIH